MTDEGAGQVGTYAYDAWGNVLSETGSEANEYKFTSRRWEAAVGLQYNRARFYDPAIGRFISPDPLTGGPDDPTISYFGGLYSAFHRFLKEYVDALQPDKLNRYAYCYNNPVNLIDPLGLENLRERSSAWKWEAKRYELSEPYVKAFAVTLLGWAVDEVKSVNAYENAGSALLGLVPDNGAMTFGDNTIYLGGDGDAFFDHPRFGSKFGLEEFAHINDQWRNEADFAFMIKYIAESVSQMLKGNDPYEDNKYEVETQAYAKKQRR